MFHFFNKKIILPYLEYHIVDHCNLKCNNCLHFCNLIDDEIFFDTEEIRQDLEELAKKVEIGTIRILGGEPLLHPNIDIFLKDTRRIFPNAFIVLVTNGTLLWKQKETFWEAVRENNITISISLYPILKNRIKDMKLLFKEHNVPTYGINYIPIFHKQLNESGNSAPNKSFKKCYSKEFINLYKHKLYQCHNCFRDYYNNKEEKNIPKPIAYDLYKMSGKEIYKKLISNAKQTDACKYCNETPTPCQWSCLTTNTKDSDN